MKTIFQLALAGILLAALSGCAVSPVTGLVCPLGMHPGPHGQRCFYN